MKSGLLQSMILVTGSKTMSMFQRRETAFYFSSTGTSSERVGNDRCTENVAAVSNFFHQERHKLLANIWKLPYQRDFNLPTEIAQPWQLPERDFSQFPSSFSSQKQIPYISQSLRLFQRLSARLDWYFAFVQTKDIWEVLTQQTMNEMQKFVRKPHVNLFELRD